MKIKDFFEKDINRNIETVIKADDREHISDEVVEYVITNEIAKKIRDFFQAYNDYTGANGVWISGFFGSGKSHLLKILSYVLENKVFDGYKSGELFAEKIEADEMLKADVLAATRIPSESILFNIDQQAQITSKADANAILSVFYKVFFDHLGYYGFQTHVAEFEMWLDKKNQYENFKSKFEAKHKKPWEEARLDYFDPLVTDDVAFVLGELNNTDSSKYEDILDDIEDKQKQSIEDFCERVHDYIKTKPKGFRLNFFVDEVGQYISDNTKLMLNLQTIAETLATRTKGASWILVTSQEDMEKVVGDMNPNQQNDFSRIQARFKIKLPLTSANVDEVIEKRLLKKNNEAKKLLVSAYKKESSHLDTLLSFSDAGVQFKGYKNNINYSNKFPFVPYQFDLFQQCRISLSSHNAFQGKHASVGERSMLGVFQQVAQSIEDKDEKALVSFDMMYEGIRKELRGEIQNSVTLSEKQLENQFAKKVLKALFLVKYYNNFKTNKRNISVLMIDDIHIDLKKHEKMIDEALNILENQSYVQRNGDVYEFLTDDEKDVEEEIKNTGIDDQAVTTELKEIFFDQIINDNKIRCLDNNQNYDFTSKIDGTILGREKELEIEIITENFIDYNNETFIRNQTMGSSGMKIVLPSNPIFMKDLKMFLKINKYVKQNQSTSSRPEIIHILKDKAQQNNERKRNLILIANGLLANAAVFMNGNKLETGQFSDGKTKVVTVFQALIKTVYSNLRMLGSVQYSEESVKNMIRTPLDQLFEIDENTMTEAESEILTFINRRKKQSDRTSLTDLRSYFTHKPYGWYPNAIWTVTASLYKRGKIEIKKDSNLLEDEDVVNALLNSSNYNNTLLETQVAHKPEAIKKLKKIYSEAFDENCSLNEAKDVAKAFKDKLTMMMIEVNKLLVQKREYPFLTTLETFADNLQRWCNKDYNFFLNNFSDFEEKLLDFKEDMFNPIKRFINGDQIGIYDSIKKLLNSDTSNFDYVKGEELETLKSLISNSKPYIGNLVRDAKTAKEELSKKVLLRIDDEKNETIDTIKKAIESLQNNKDYKKLDKTKQTEIMKPFDEEINKLLNQKYIAVIRDVKNNIPNILTEQLNKLKPVSQNDGKVHEPTPEYITRTSIKIDFPKSKLDTENDVDEYVEALRKALKEKIKNNKRIVLS